MLAVVSKQNLWRCLLCRKARDKPSGFSFRRPLTFFLMWRMRSALAIWRMLFHTSRHSTLKASAGRTWIERCSIRPCTLLARSHQCARGKNRLSKSHLNLVEQIFLVFLHRQDVIPAAFCYFLSNGFLAEHGAASHDFIF